MKKFLLAAAAVFFFALFGFVRTGYAADDSIHLYLNSKVLNPEVPPVIMNGKTMVPIRIISEELGAKVSWDKTEQKVTVEKQDLNVELYINQTKATVNGSFYQLEQAPIIINGNTLLPVRFISEKMGMKVIWDKMTRSVFIYQWSSDNKSPTNTASAPAASSGNTGAAKPPVTTAEAPAASSGTVEETKLSETASKTTSNSTDLSSANSAGDASEETGNSTQPAAVDEPAVFAGGGDFETKPAVFAGGGDFETKPAVFADGGDFETKPAVFAGGGDFGDPSIPEIHTIALEGDILRIEATGNVQPKQMFLDNPPRIVLDIPNAALASMVNGSPSVQNGEIPFDHPNITKIRYAKFLDNPSTVRIVVDLKQKIDYTLIDSKIPGEIAISFKKEAKYKVVLDAGHGGKDSGAISVNGRMEKDLNLAVILAVAKLLENEPQIEVVLTRSDDTFVELDERAAIANRLHADLFVSVHANTVDKPSIKGIETYYTHDYSAALAGILHRNILAATGSNDRKVRTEDFRVTKMTTMPAVLCEIGYLSNVSEEESLYQKETQERIAASIAAGIKEYLQIP